MQPNPLSLSLTHTSEISEEFEIPHSMARRVLQAMQDDRSYYATGRIS